MSRGAWPYYYQLGLDFRSDPQGRDAYGIYAFKNELIYNGFSKGINPTLPYWGSGVVTQTKKAQKFFGLTVDGVLGPMTARCLFRKRCTTSELALTLPIHLLAKIKTLESGDDPVAQGVVDPDDEGLFQENLPSNPSLTQIECWTPSFIIPHAASQLFNHIKDCGNSSKAGTAAWNVGNFYANEWRLAGFPTSGGPIVDGQDIYSRCDQYVNLVNAEPL